MHHPFPVIDLEATGKNIKRLLNERDLSAADLQSYFHFESSRAIYKWQAGQCLPSLDNLYALSKLLGVSMDQILVDQHAALRMKEPPDPTRGPVFLCFFARAKHPCGGPAGVNEKAGPNRAGWRWGGPA